MSSILNRAARYFFQKRGSELSAERVTQEQRSRFNPLRGFEPDRLVAAIDAHRTGSVAPLARIIEELETRDDMMANVSRKMRASVGRCAHQVLLVEGYEDDPRAQEHKRILTRFWANIEVTSLLARNERGSARLLKKQMAGAISHGFNVHEIVWIPLPDGSISARFIQVPLWLFENRTGELRFLARYGAYDGVEMPPGEWLVTVGDGIGIAASVLAMAKTLSRNDWLLFSERCGQPGIHASTGAAEGSSAWELLVRAVGNFGREWAIVTDNETKIEPITMNTGGELPYPKMIEMANKGIAALYRGADLSTISGAHAQSTGASVQESETDLLEADACELISETLNAQVESFVIRYTTGDDTPLAYLSVAPTSRPNVDEEIRIDNHLVDLGVRLSKADALARYGRTEYDSRNSEDGALERQQPRDGGMGLFNEAKATPAAAPAAVSPLAQQGFAPAASALTELAHALTADLAPVSARVAALLDLPEAERQAAAQKLLGDLPALLPDDPETAAVLEEAIAETFAAALTDDADALANANPDQPRGNPTNSGQFAKVPSGGARAREPETKGTKDRYGETDPAKLEANPDLNEERARAAFDEVKRKEKGYVDKAAYCAETGWIRFDYGDPGDPAPDATGRTYVGGHGISHILAKHPDDAKHLPGVIARGSVHKHEDPAKLYVVTDTHFAILGPLSKGHKRVITEFEPADTDKITIMKKRPRVRRPGAN